MAKTVDLEFRAAVVTTMEPGERWAVQHEVLSANGSRYSIRTEGEIMEIDVHGITVQYISENGTAPRPRRQKFIPWARIYEMDLLEAA